MKVLLSFLSQFSFFFFLLNLRSDLFHSPGCDAALTLQLSSLPHTRPGCWTQNLRRRSLNRLWQRSPGVKWGHEQHPQHPAGLITCLFSQQPERLRGRRGSGWGREWRWKWEQRGRARFIPTRLAPPTARSTWKTTPGVQVDVLECWSSPWPIRAWPASGEDQSHAENWIRDVTKRMDQKDFEELKWIDR